MYQQFYRKRKNKHYKYYIIIAISIVAISISIITSLLVVRNHNNIIRIAEEQKENYKKMQELKFLEKERKKKEKENKIKAEDAKLKLTSTAQKERKGFKYNIEAQKEIDEIFDSNKKEVYLTFDDGPSKYTNKILDELKKTNVKATFFILGTNIEGRENEIRRIYNEGHTIANHSYSHRYEDIYKNPEATLKEYNKTEKKLKKILGKDFNSNLFRFPGGSVGGYYEKQKKKSREYFNKKNIAFVDWNALTDDSVGADTTKEQIKVFNETRKGEKALIVLQHDSYTSDKTAGTVKVIIEQLKKEKYVFKNFNNILVKEEKDVTKVVKLDDES